LEYSNYTQSFALNNYTDGAAGVSSSLDVVPLLDE